jgi:hypothetical protein
MEVLVPQPIIIDGVNLRRARRVARRESSLRDLAGFAVAVLIVLAVTFGM